MRSDVVDVCLKIKSSHLCRTCGHLWVRKVTLPRRSYSREYDLIEQYRPAGTSSGVSHPPHHTSLMSASLISAPFLSCCCASSLGRRSLHVSILPRGCATPSRRCARRGDSGEIRLAGARIGNSLTPGCCSTGTCCSHVQAVQQFTRAIGEDARAEITWPDTI